MRGWLDPVLDAAQMRGIDGWAINECGRPSLELMENAGWELAERALALAQAQVGTVSRIAAVCGGGNNGGDGLVAARHLAARGIAAAVVMVAVRERLSADAATNLERLPAQVPVQWAQSGEEVAQALAGADLVIDALLGTGFSGLPREPVAGAIRAINEVGLPVVAADIASGVDASTGEVAGGGGEGESAVRADLTVTFHRAKIGHLVAPGKRHCGRLSEVEIGIPEGGPVEFQPTAGRITAAVLGELPTRDVDSTKFTAGQVVIAGGSRGLTGAPCMSALAAIRAGAGYATVAVPADLESIFEIKLTEVMSVGCPGPPGRLGPESVAAAKAACEKARAVLLGPGLGREPDTLEFARRFAEIECPLVIDADGLAAFAGSDLELLRERQATVLTPHEGELGRLLEIESREVSRHRLASAREVAERSGAVVVLKGDDTIVVGSGETAINTCSAPALATAGTGDVLAGALAALLAQTGDPFLAAAAAVFAHARAGQIAAAKVGRAESVIATDVIAALPRGLRR